MALMVTEMGRDFLLQSLVDQVNQTDMEFTITLLCSGFLVSGSLISGHKYYNEISRLFDSYEDTKRIVDELGKTFDPYIKEPVEEIKQEQVSGEMEETEDTDFLRIKNLYSIHLKDAKFYSVNDVPTTNQGVLWRGRLIDVSGFNFGSFAS